MRRKAPWLAILYFTSFAISACDDSAVQTVRYDLGLGGNLDGGTEATDASRRDASVSRDASVTAPADMFVTDAMTGGRDMSSTCNPRTVCSTGECGDVSDGCEGILPCGGCGSTGLMCGDDHMCTCEPPAIEPGEDAAHATMRSVELSDYTEVVDSFMSNLEVSTDVDWYKWHVVDSSGDPTNPVMTVTLTPPALPLGQDYTLTGYFVCDEGEDGNANECTEGTPSTEFSHAGCSEVMPLSGGGVRTFTIDTDCTGLNEDGTLYVRVQARLWMNGCTGYTLSAQAN